jgi:hypothetical protein
VRFVHLYLIGYFVLILGAGLALWQAGVLGRIPAIWILISAIIVVGLGILMAATSVRPTTITRNNAVWHTLWLPSGMRFGCGVVALLATAALLAGCKEEGTIKVHRLSFKGVKAVDESRLKDALATHQSSKIPWGRKYFFDRSRFDADLKRIQAFYADRGYPDARVSGFDVTLNDKQDAVDLTVTIAEGEPVNVAAIDFVGFDAIPEAHLNQMKSGGPLKVGQPRDRQLVVSTHELAVNELRDHGYPYAKVATNEDDGADGKSATLTFTANPGTLAHFGPVEVQGNQSVSDHVIERELTFKPGDLYRRSVVQDSQRRLYGMELFQFVNVEPQNPELQPTDVPMKVTVAEGKHQRVNFGVGYGTEENARADVEYHHLNFRWSPIGGRARALCRSRRSAGLQSAVLPRAAFLAGRRSAGLVHVHAGIQVGHRRRQGGVDAQDQPADVMVCVAVE